MELRSAGRWMKEKTFSQISSGHANMLTAGLSIKNICDFPLSLILLICSSAPCSFASSSLLSIQEKHRLLTAQNKTTARAPTSVIHDTKYCTIIIQHVLHKKATAKLTRNSRAPRLVNSRPSSPQFLQAIAVMAAHPALLVVNLKPRTVHRDAAISKSEEPRRVYINLQTLWRPIAIPSWNNRLPLDSTTTNHPPLLLQQNVYDNGCSLLPDEGGISPCGNLEDESGVGLSLKLDSPQQRHHLHLPSRWSLNIFGQKHQKKERFLPNFFTVSCRIFTSIRAMTFLKGITWKSMRIQSKERESKRARVQNTSKRRCTMHSSRERDVNILRPVQLWTGFFRWLSSFIWLAPCWYRPLWREGQEHFCSTTALPSSPRQTLHPYSRQFRRVHRGSICFACANKVLDDG